MLSAFTPFRFETASPESVGISRASIAAFEEEIRSQNIGHQGYMLYRHGKLAASSLAEPYRPTDKRHVYSVSKSWTSTAVGIAVDEGLLSVEDHLVDFFPDLTPENAPENLRKMKLRHVLSMNTGHQTDTLGRVASREPGWAKRFLSLDVENEPGTHFAYNSTATYMLSAVLTRVTGQRMVDYLKPRLFNPLGIENVWWEESPEGVSDAGWGIHVSAEDMLKLGVLYLHKGMWEGKRILSEKWVEDASSFVSDNGANHDSDWQVGYGYKFWRCRHNCYRADGAYGQFIVISPEKDMAAVILSEDNRLQGILDVFWDTIFASLSDEALPESDGSEDIAVRPYQTLPDGDEAFEDVSFTAEDNPEQIAGLTLRHAGDALALTLTGKLEHSIELICTRGRWEYNRFSHCPITPTAFLANTAIGVPAEIAASYGVKDGHLTAALQFVTTPHGMTLDIDFAAKTLTVSRTISRGQADPVIRLS